MPELVLAVGDVDGLDERGHRRRPGPQADDQSDRDHVGLIVVEDDVDGVADQVVGDLRVENGVQEDVDLLANVAGGGGPDQPGRRSRTGPAAPAAAERWTARSRRPPASSFRTASRPRPWPTCGRRPSATACGPGHSRSAPDRSRPGAMVPCSPAGRPGADPPTESTRSAGAAAMMASRPRRGVRWRARRSRLPRQGGRRAGRSVRGRRGLSCSHRHLRRLDGSVPGGSGVHPAGRRLRAGVAVDRPRAARGRVIASCAARALRVLAETIPLLRGPRVMGAPGGHGGCRDGECDGFVGFGLSEWDTAAGQAHRWRPPAAR